MNRNEILTLKASLEARQSTISKKLAHREEIAVQQTPDALDEVQFAAERELAISLLNHDSLLLNNLKAALRRIEEGNYGICIQCEEEIGPKRLQAVPWTSLCLRCQEESDRGV